MSRRKRHDLAPRYCEVCGYSRFRTLHRILPGHEGGIYEYGNVISLCYNCHIEADKEFFPRELLFDIVEARINGDAETSHWQDGELTRRARRFAAKRGRGSAESPGAASSLNGN